MDKLKGQKKGQLFLGNLLLMEKANQSLFEKRVVYLVEELDKERQKHQKFNHKKELISALGLEQNDWSKYKHSRRRLPAEKQSTIRKYLIEEYGVNPQWLDDGRAPVFAKEIRNAVNEVAAPYGIFGDKQVEYLQKENESLKSQVAGLQAEIIMLQKELLECVRSK